MAEQIDQQPANDHPGIDEEGLIDTTPESKKLRRKKRIKCIASFVVLQIAQNLIFYFIFFRVRTLRARVGTVNVQHLATGSQLLPYFDVNFTAQVGIKNRNFGSFKFNGTNAIFTYQGVTVGQAVIPNGKAGWLSTKKVNVTVNVNSIALPNSSSLGSDLSAGLLNLSSHANISGRVAVFSLIKKNRSARMNCTMVFNLSAMAVQDLDCK
ncbi:late embryogenesis abundant protein At1g64065-like [Alnus glutinosa]|uniref:late embryogenesis abundant protein At1g64065-like n=1 Tax=Alnus glutinosa TaxID=3517 RepID=UPI002D79582F|nr:late embryogenesis abundant protein At1g64065-like [Alnus glutinosa]